MREEGEDEEGLLWRRMMGWTAEVEGQTTV